MKKYIAPRIIVRQTELASGLMAASGEVKGTSVYSDVEATAGTSLSKQRSIWDEEE
ncbi:MAG: hypothetical protein I3J02_06705 [Prevotella sp.]|nr:hypothetical protein [Prevotella sp.]